MRLDNETIVQTSSEEVTLCFIYTDLKLPPFRSFGLSVSISTKSGLLEPFLFWPDELDDPLLLLTPRYTIFYIRSEKIHNTSKDLLEMLYLIHYIHDGS